MTDIGPAASPVRDSVARGRLRAAQVLQGFTIAVVAGVSMLTLHEASMPFLFLDAFVALALIWTLVSVLWLLSVLFASLAGSFRTALVAPLVLAAITVVASVSGIPRAIRMALSDSAATRFVQQVERRELVIDLEDEYEPQAWAGYMPVYWVEEVDGKVHLVSGFVGSDTPAGITYLPDGPPDGTNLEYARLYGHWYRWSPW